MKEKKINNNDDFKIDESQFEIDQKQYETSEETPKKEGELEPTVEPEIDEKNETIHFPWFIAILIGALMVLIIACIIVIKVLEG